MTRLNSALALLLVVLVAAVVALSVVPARAQDRSSTPAGNPTPAPVLDDGGWITLGNWTVQWQPSTGLLRLLPLASPTPDAPSPTPTAPPPTPTATPSATPTLTPTASQTPTATNTPGQGEPTQEITPPPTPPPSTDIPRVCEGGVAVSALRVRADHSTSAAQVGTLYIGQRVVIERMYVISDAVNEWAYIRGEGVAGWVASYYNSERYLVWDDEDEHCYPPDMPIEWEVPPPSTPSPFDGDTLSGLHFAWFSDHAKAAQTAPLVGMAKCLTLTGSMCDTMRAANPRLVTIYRDYRSECPTRDQVYGDAAGYYARLRALWQDAPGYDFYELQNECAGFSGQEDYAALAQFSIDVATLAAADGYCILALSSYPGSPELDEFIQLVPYFKWIDTHPCGTWRGGSPKFHGLATHATGYCPFSTPKYPWVGWSWVAGRHVLFAEAVAQVTGYQIKDKNWPWLITELGFTYGQDEDENAFTAEELRACINETTAVLTEQGIVNGYMLWNVGKVGAWLDYVNYLPFIFIS